MTEFYGTLETSPKIGKAEALRQAQINLLKGKYKTDGARKNDRSDVVKLDGSTATQPPFEKNEKAPFAHHFYWSPFIIFGYSRFYEFSFTSEKNHVS